MLQEKLYQTGALPASCGAMAQSFETLQPSAYKDGSFRLRRYSKVDFEQSTGRVSVQHNATFVQSGELNRFQGGVVREYDDLTDATIKDSAFVAMLGEFVSVAGLPNQSCIEIHQMRIIAKDAHHQAVATPEGIHQDGFDFVGVFTVARHNVTGGDLLLWTSPEADKPIAKQSPQAGDYCIIKDDTLWHSATNVVADGSQAGYWDLFVLTAKV